MEKLRRLVYNFLVSIILTQLWRNLGFRAPTIRINYEELVTAMILEETT